MRLLISLMILAASLAVATRGAPQTAGQPSPQITEHAQPIYPAIAKTAHVQGDVVVRFMTDGMSVTSADAESGPALLEKASIDNVKTWKFAQHAPSTFSVTFRYKLPGDSTEVVFPDVRPTVSVFASPSPMIIDYSTIGLGKWRAQLRSHRGTLSQIFEFGYTGPEGESLECSVPGHEEMESEYGYKEGDILTFGLKLKQQDGHLIETSFVGRLSGNKIIGTFVDDTGTTGDWRAVKIN